MNTSIVIALVTVALLFVCVFAGVHISFNPDVPELCGTIFWSPAIFLRH